MIWRLVEEHVLSENLHFAGGWCEVATFTSTTSQQIVDQTEVFQELVSPEVCKLIHSVINKKKGVKHSFHQKEDFKTKVIDS